LFNKLKTSNDPVSLIGFSVGAAAIWMISDRKKLKVNAAQCFYGSQIRHHTNITPSFPIELIFPLSEPHFSVTEAIIKLSGRPNVKITQVPYLHGFMNQCSTNYNAVGYELFKYIPRPCTAWHNVFFNC